MARSRNRNRSQRVSRRRVQTRRNSRRNQQSRSRSRSRSQSRNRNARRSRRVRRRSSRGGASGERKYEVHYAKSLKNREELKRWLLALAQENSPEARNAFRQYLTEMGIGGESTTPSSDKYFADLMRVNGADSNEDLVEKFIELAKGLGKL